MKFNRLPLFLLVCATMVFAADPEAPLAIKVGALKGPTGIGMVSLFENPPVLPQNVTATYVALASADIMAAKVMSGEMDLAVLPVNMAAKLYSAGLPYRALAVVGNGMVTIVTNDALIRSVADLKGKEVYVAGQAATPDYVFRTILKKNGMDPDVDLKLVYSMPYPEIAASIVAGRISTAILPEPFATLALSGDSKARVAFDINGLWSAATGQSGYPMSLLVVKDSFLKARPAAVKALLDAYKASILWTVANPASAGALVEKHDLGLKATIAAKAIPRCAYVFQPARDARLRIEALLSVFLAADPKSIGGKLPDDGFYADAVSR